MSGIRQWLGRRLDFSPKFWGVFACFICSFFFLMFQGGKLAFMVFAIVSALCVYLGLGKWSGVQKAEGRRTLLNAAHDATVDAGTQVKVKIDVHIPGFWPIPYVTIKDRLVPRSGRELLFEASLVPDWRRRGEVEYTTPPLRRGFYQFGTTECATEDIFGMFQHSGTMALPGSFRVLPMTVPIKEWRQFHQMLKGNHHHSTTTRALRETTQINGVREYIYGDRISRIHWNATAKTGTWKSKEFERESLPKTIVMLDRQEQSYRSKERFELAVSVVASLIDYGANEELAIGLLSVGKDAVYIEPKRGAAYRDRIVNHLIDVEADGRYALPDVLKDYSRQFVQGSFFVVVSPQRSETMMQALNWLNQRQINPCHLWISSGYTPVEREDWLRQLRMKGYLGYSVMTLDELPHVLGGRS